MRITPKSLLPDVIAAAHSAGDMLAREFRRPDGPRFSDHVTAPVDHEIEMFLRDRLIGLLPGRFVGEEAGVVADDGNAFCWVVDPHDGTRAFLEGKRGSAVSIALMHDGALVLGVVYAPLSPDRGPDMIAWAEGTGITRNGVPVSIDLSKRKLAEDDVVFLNHGAWQRPVWNGLACAPGRFMPLPSIAYRLARVAVGDGIATQTLRPVNALDIAAGHALLLAAGGVLVAEDGTPVTYTALGESRPSACFGGAPLAVETLRNRAWRGSTETRREERIVLVWPRPAGDARQDRAVGCLLGLTIGASLDAPQGLNGQGTAVSDSAIALGRHLIGRAVYDPDAAMAVYQRCGSEAGSASPLARAAVIGIWAGDTVSANAIAMEDAMLTDPGVAHVCGALAAAIAVGVAGGDRSTMLLHLGALPDADRRHIAAILLAVDHLSSGTGAENGVRDAVGRSEDAATITGALLGAVDGRMAFPPAWTMPVLTCRPEAGLGARNPRPPEYWTDDLVDLAEALLAARRDREM